MKIPIAKIIILLVSLFFLLIIGYFTTLNWLDPDFGWHLKTGELILERGVPKIDWYSFTMPDFLWIDHEWLTDVFIFKINSLFGFKILLLIFLFIATIAFFVSIKLKYFWYYFFPVFFGYFSCLNFFGIRPQMITLFFIAVLLKLIDSSLKNPNSRLIYLCPLLFLIWTNLHGGFFAGLFILFLITALEGFKKTTLFKKIISGKHFSGQKFKENESKTIFSLLIISIISFLATLVNPYGIRIYEEVFRSIGNSYVGLYITEWLPLFFSTGTNIFQISYLAVFLGLLIPQYKEIELNHLTLATIFLAFALLHQRHFPIYVIITIPIFAEVLFQTKQKIPSEKLQFLFGGIKKWRMILIFIGIISYGLHPFLANSQRSISYPEKAISFLKTLPLSENLFNEYGWGGYLIWKIPERKVFIDGRMPSWRKDDRFIFGDYLKIEKTEKGFQEILAQYEIKIVLLRNNKKEGAKINNKAKTENRLSRFLKRQNWLLKALRISSEKSLKEELIKSGWQVIYEDETAIILRC